MIASVKPVTLVALIGLIGLIAVAAFSTAACGRATDDKPAASTSTPSLPQPAQHDAGNIVSVSDEMLRDLRITTAKVEQRRGGEAATLLGELGVNENAYAEVGAPLQARVTALHAAPGQTVRRGAALATVESGELAKARSEVILARARVTLAQRTLERKQGLNAERIVPAREVQEAEGEQTAATAQLEAALASLRAYGIEDGQAAGTGGVQSVGSAGRQAVANAGERLGIAGEAMRGRRVGTANESVRERPADLTLRAPVAGVVLERVAVLGQVTEPAKALFRIADLSTLWLTVHAFERDAVRVRVGAPASIAFAAIPGRTFDGVVALIGHGVDPQSRTVAVRIELPNRDGLLRPGMSAAARLPVGDRGAMLLAVPAAALQRVRERWCVFVPKDSRRFEIRPVGRGRDLGGEVEIVSGVTGGETIVVDGAFLLKAEVERGAEAEHEAHR